MTYLLVFFGILCAMAAVLMFYNKQESGARALDESKLQRMLNTMLRTHPPVRGQLAARMDQSLKGMLPQAVSQSFALHDEQHAGRCILQEVDVLELGALGEEEQDVVLMCDYMFTLDAAEQDIFARISAMTHSGITMHALKVKPNEAAGQMLKSPEHMYFQGFDGALGDGVQASFELGMALLFEHDARDVIADLGVISSSSENASGVKAWLGFMERSNQRVTLSYLIRGKASLMESEVGVWLEVLADMHRHALCLREYLACGVLVTRCMEHLRHEEDSPGGIKALALRVLARLREHQNQVLAALIPEIDALVWQDRRAFTLEDLTLWYRVEMEALVAKLEEDDLFYYGGFSDQEALFEALWKSCSAFQLIAHAGLGWAIQRRVIERVLREDEGLALHGPAMVNRLDPSRLTVLLGFLSRYASPVLWSAPWFKKALKTRMAQIDEGAFWEVLYESVWRNDRHNDGFKSIRVARKLLLEMAWEVSNPTTLRGGFFAYVMCSYADEAWPQGAPHAWARFLDVTSAEQLQSLVSDAWKEEDGNTVSLLTAMWRRVPPEQSIYRAHVSALSEVDILKLFVDANRRQKELVDWTAYDGQTQALIFAASSHEDGPQWKNRQEALVEYIQRVEQAERITKDRVTLLYAIGERAPALKIITKSTIDRWTQRLGEQGARGAISVASSSDGKLTMTQPE